MVPERESRPEYGTVSVFYDCMEGIFIPMEFYKVKELRGLERDILALYKYYTDNGKYKCCVLTNRQIAEEFCIGIRHLQEIKQHLKELGYIRTDGGVKVFYMGIEGRATAQGGMSHSAPQGRATAHPKDEPQRTHKKEKKEEKRNKKEKGGLTPARKEEDMSNFDRLIARLPDEYKKGERIDYIKNNFMDRINRLDMDDSILDTWVIGIKNEVNKRYPIEYVIKKEVPKDDMYDMF